jgi:hypothetical protein
VGVGGAWRVGWVPGVHGRRGLAHLERAMEKVERRMSLLGARMLEGTLQG